MTHNETLYKVLDALNNLVATICADEWADALARKLETAEEYFDGVTFDDNTQDWNREEMLWMLLVGMFGDWGVSMRRGWIEDTKGAADFIRRYLLSEAVDPQEFNINYDDHTGIGMEKTADEMFEELGFTLDGDGHYWNDQYECYDVENDESVLVNGLHASPKIIKALAKMIEEKGM